MKIDAGLVRRALARATWAGLLMVGGCSFVNVQRDDPGNKWFDHRPNDTRSSVFVRPFPSGPESFDLILDPVPGPTSVLRRPTSHPVLPKPDEDGVFVGLAISGGGSRSANFSAACMFELQRLRFMKHVDYISTVSGGSLTGALYCVTDDNEWTPGFAQKKLGYNFASDLIVNTFMPWHMLAFVLSDWDRSDILAMIFRDNLFTRNNKELTYADLRTDRPRLLINATELQSGRRFVFCNETFDTLNSDLGKYPLSYAVAASSSVPVLLHQVTLRDFSTTYPQYVHLIDGGVIDNLGVQSLVEVYREHVQYAQESHLPDPYPRGAIFLVIDSRVPFDARLSHRSDTNLFDTIKAAVGFSSGKLMDRASSSTLGDMILKNAPDDVQAHVLRDKIDRFRGTGFLQLEDASGHQVSVMHLSLSRLNDVGELPFPSFRESVNNIATYFNIDHSESYRLWQAADLLVKRKFQPQVELLVRHLENPASTSPTTQTTPKK